MRGRDAASVAELRRLALAGIPEGDEKPLRSARIAITLLADRLAATEPLVESIEEWRELEDSPIRRGFAIEDARIGFDEAWAKYRAARDGTPKPSYPRTSQGRVA